MDYLYPIVNISFYFQIRQVRPTFLFGAADNIVGAIKAIDESIIQINQADNFLQGSCDFDPE